MDFLSLRGPAGWIHLCSSWNLHWSGPVLFPRWRSWVFPACVAARLNGKPSQETGLFLHCGKKRQTYTHIFVWVHLWGFSLTIFSPETLFSPLNALKLFIYLILTQHYGPFTWRFVQFMCKNIPFMLMTPTLDLIWMNLEFKYDTKVN